ncbi:MAG TPA: hypothetical protein VHY22_06015 [Chthoniobacteraceae bacterium]|jgi:uncharacterized protein YpuA (DUF1002 family)|nr:hypothetical protein [Chthoniobacteraceae bacterium]
MKRISILPLAIILLSVAAAQSQAPVSDDPLTELQSIVTGNKVLIDKQSKTLDLLDKLDLQAQQLKAFGNRG